LLFFLAEAKEAAERRVVEAAAKETAVDYFGAPLPHFTCFTGTKVQILKQKLDYFGAPLPHFTCFTGTNVQILTQKLEEQSTSSPRTPTASSLTKASR
jgi:hypothetical protein